MRQDVCHDLCDAEIRSELKMVLSLVRLKELTGVFTKDHGNRR